MIHYNKPSKLEPYWLYTPNCPDGMCFSSLEQLAIFLSETVRTVRINVSIEAPI